MSLDKIRARAEFVNSMYRVSDGNGYADLDTLVTSLGGTITRDRGIVEMVADPDGKFNVVLPVVTTKARDRLLTAHTLGHVFLHLRNTDAASTGGEFRQQGKCLYEIQANVFASSLLMPQQEFERAYKKLDGGLRKLAVRFGVSVAAVEVREHVLGLRPNSPE